MKVLWGIAIPMPLKRLSSMLRISFGKSLVKDGEKPIY